VKAKKLSVWKRIGIQFVREEELTMLTETEVGHFKERLLEERNELIYKIKALDRELARDQYEYPLDVSDSAMEIYNKEEMLADRNRLNTELAKVDHALHRIEEGTYGTSEVSGKPIPVERLEALPWATTRVDESPPNGWLRPSASQ
jgi:RNA polymerase-binding protein DksA